MPAEARAGDLRPADGAPILSFTLDRLGGGRVSLAEMVGRVVLVHFFATWCAPCREELASLDRLARSSGDMTVLAIDVGEVEMRVARFIADNPVSFPVLLDGERTTARAWDIHALPSTVILDRSLAPRLAVTGDLDWQRPDVVARIAALAVDLIPATKTKIGG